ncbi:MAG: anti-sigma factor antagonist [Halobacteriota archaeon]
MEIKTIGEVKVAVIVPRFDSHTAEEVETALTAVIEKGTKRVLCDFSLTKYISSAGLRVLLLTAKGLQKSGGQLVLCSLSSTVREVFEIAGLTQLFTIYDSVGLALKDLEWKDNKTGEKHWKIKSIDPRIVREIGFHGSHWHTAHGGYFADPAIALPLINAVKDAIAISSPAVVADLGAGTGFILSELLKQGQYPGVRLINVDISERQLEKENDPRTLSLHVSVDEITRELLDPGNRPLLFVMRSVLHYFGHKGLRPLLAYLRSQMKTGEFFVHQTACFEHESDAQRVNLLFQRMRVNKWFPTVSELSKYLREEGWTVDRISPAPKLLATPLDLVERYQLGKKEIFRIRDEISQLYGEAPGMFVATPDGFNVYAHFKIFTCRAT